MGQPGIMRGVVQPYEWGSVDALPRITGTEPTGQPQAELWLGAHPRAPSTVVLDGVDRRLDQVIAADPAGELGEAVARSFQGELPYLLKILAVARPLSLQAHPTRSQAQDGFTLEDQKGIARDAYNRSYRDVNHKPELICALEPFTAFCGFRPSDSAVALLQSLEVPSLMPVVERLQQGDTAGALRWLLSQQPAASAELAQQVAAACARGGPWPEERRWATIIGQHHPGDIGIVVALLLNLVRLEPGQALFLGAGNLHAYLHGVAVEIMANSDNVLRGGLTVKHVDATALLDVVDCRPAAVEVQTPQGGEFTFASAVPDFSLTRMEVDGPVLCQPRGPEIVLCTAGHLSVADHHISGGGAVWLPAATGDYYVSGSGLAFRASVG